MKYDVLVIGELLADLISDEFVVTLGEAKRFTIHQGGSPANLCANLKWLGAEAGIVSCVGDDAIGRALIASFRNRGLDTTHIYASPAFPTTLVLVGKSKGTPDFVAYRMADTQIPSVPEILIDNSAILHTSAFALSKEPARQNIMEAFMKAKKRGKLISADWNYAPAIWGESGRDVFDQLCTLEPLLKLSSDDVLRFFGDHLSIDEMLKELERYQTTLTCLTCGKDGVYYKAGRDDWKFKPAKAVDVVRDVTGAGDAFWSGFLFAYTRKRSIDSCIEEALDVAAKKIQKVGPLDLVS